MPTSVPSYPRPLLALVPGAVEALDAHDAAKAEAAEKQTLVLAHGRKLAAARGDLTRTTAQREADDMKHDALYRELAAAEKERSRAWERYASIVNGQSRSADVRGAIAAALPDLDRAARDAWTAFGEAFAAREAAYRLLGSPAEKHHYRFRMRHLDQATSERPHLDRVAQLVETFPSPSEIRTALDEHQTEES